MASQFRIFTSFAVEDARLRTMLVGQAKNERTPFEFVDMSVKEPWDNSWKTNCRSRIRGCDGLVAILTTQLFFADGALWEIRCAREENLPVLGITGMAGALVRKNWLGRGSFHGPGLASPPSSIPCRPSR